MHAKEGRPVCAVCGREAIGMQSFGCCTAAVCLEHAEPALRDAKAGELVVWGMCVFQRFDEPPRENGRHQPGSVRDYRPA